ncbi:MAG: 5-bromo-4-chloroindolyl phosphate hydrolysis family protein [Rhodobacteraceae bacterium]|nr:5-bromo-4-chloroindolyl phosphate hydrolysis family protein [Paracoccaceae bacterium]
MAKRFGGPYSSDGSANAQNKTEAAQIHQEAVLDEARIDAAGGRAVALYVAPVLLVFTSFGDGPVTLILALLGAVFLGLGAWLLREGMRAHAAYDARTIARRPALPRKILAAILTGLGVALAAWIGAGSLIGALLYGGIATALQLAAFGIDPLKDKRTEGIDLFQQDRVARVVDEAEDYLDAMRDHISTLGDRGLDRRVEQFQAMARRMITVVEEDPRDLTSARKFLGVYLMGARDASVKFADLYKKQRDEGARAAYEALLTDLEENFATRTQQMLADGRTDMDIEIKVLRDRLQREH